MLFLHLQDVLEHAPGGGIVVGEPANHLDVDLDCDPLRDQILPDHLDQGFALRVVFAVRSLAEPLGVEVGLAAELGDALGDPVGVLLLLVGML